MATVPVSRVSPSALGSPRVNQRSQRSGACLEFSCLISPRFAQSRRQLAWGPLSHRCKYLGCEKMRTNPLFPILFRTERVFCMNIARWTSCINASHFRTAPRFCGNLFYSNAKEKSTIRRAKINILIANHK